MFSTNWEIIGRRALFEATWRVAFLAPQTSDGAAARAPRLFRRATHAPPRALRGVHHKGSTTTFSTKLGTNPITRCRGLYPAAVQPPGSNGLRSNFGNSSENQVVLHDFCTIYANYGV
jgi:hypothetical protein